MTPFHIWLSLNNLTTHEHIKRRYYYDDPENPADGPTRRKHPFDKGSACANFNWVLCRPLESSLLLEYVPLTSNSLQRGDGFLPSDVSLPQPPNVVFQIQADVIETTNPDGTFLDVRDQADAINLEEGRLKQS
ncbi:hypothetical protein HDU97_002168 [Phlyctochytrium planicorne]|nr:hypothetical protein HDU97_002168 [Phlyctochytrium planicorne]